MLFLSCLIALRCSSLGKTPHNLLSTEFELNASARDTFRALCPNCQEARLETLSKDDDDGSENVGKKMNLLSFKLNRVYLDPLNMLNTGDFSWS